MNNSLEQQLKQILFLGGKINHLTVDQEGLKTFLTKYNDCYYVSVPYPGKEIFEKFVGMEVAIKEITIENGNAIRCLSLSAKKEVDFETFLLIACDFCKAENRVNLLSNPYDWIDKWKTITGDSLGKAKVYDVLGELLVLKHLYKLDNTFLWEGAKSGTHDLVGKNSLAEVKSTITKTGFEVSINSSFQLSSNKPLSLFFVRLEKKPNEYTIDSVVKELIEMGYPEKDLEESLIKKGFRKGSRARNESYSLLWMNEYPVTKENFPVFSLEDFNNAFAPKKNIVAYSITLDLTTIGHNVIYGNQE